MTVFLEEQFGQVGIGRSFLISTIIFYHYFYRTTHIAKHLLGAKAHRQREEQVLFPELEKRGVFGPPQVMRMEHEDLRNQK